MTTTNDQLLVDWCRSSVGQRIVAMESAIVDKLLRRCLGYYFVHLGPWPAASRYQATPIKRQVVVDRHVRDSILPRITSNMTDLPIKSDTVDAIYCPHVLEFTDNPHDILRELERILVPEGYLIISCFSAWNFWNIWRSLPGRTHRMPPAHILSCRGIQDWLKLLGFDIIEVETVSAVEPAMGHAKRGWSRWPWLIKLRKWFSSAGGFIIMAQKQQIALTPVKYKWSLRSKIITASLVEPSARS